jgi:hypothetical protein
MTWDARRYRDHVSARMNDVMWHEERLWNIGVLQRVHLSNLVLNNSYWTDGRLILAIR